MRQTNKKGNQVNRKKWKDESNNRENPNQNVCCQAVANWFGTATEVRYLHCMSDLVRSVRTKYTVRSRLSTVGKRTVGQIRKRCEAITANESIAVKGFIVRVDGHVVLLDKMGLTVVDTDPRKRDKRKITHCYVVYN
jgi:hypothetical protein